MFSSMSLRRKILAITLLPLLLSAALIVLLTYTQQSGRYTSLLVRSGAQSAATFGGGIQDLMDSSGQPLTSSEIQENVQMRLLELVTLGATPLNFAALYGKRGELLAAHDKLNTGATVQSSVLRQRFAKLMAGRSQDLSGYARQVAAFKTTGAQVVPAALSGAFGQRNTTVIGYPLPGGAGAVVLGLNSDDIRRQVVASIVPTVALTVLIAAALAALAAAFASGLSRRIQRLSARVDAISMGDIERPISADQNDELGKLAEAVERMRVSLETVMKRL